MPNFTDTVFRHFIKPPGFIWIIIPLIAPAASRS